MNREPEGQADGLPQRGKEVFWSWSWYAGDEWSVVWIGVPPARSRMQAICRSINMDMLAFISAWMKASGMS